MKLVEVLDEKDELDRWIKGWTNFPSKTVSPKIKSLLLKHYPCKSGTYYRGMIFKTKASFDKFMKFAKTGKYPEKNISSWTNDEEQAEAYAAFGDEYDHDDNYGAVIISTTLKSGEGADLRQSRFGENEVLVMPKDFVIKIVNQETYK